MIGSEAELYVARRLISAGCEVAWPIDQYTFDLVFRQPGQGTCAGWPRPDGLPPRGPRRWPWQTLQVKTFDQDTNQGRVTTRRTNASRGRKDIKQPYAAGDFDYLAIVERNSLDLWIVPGQLIYGVWNFTPQLEKWSQFRWASDRSTLPISAGTFDQAVKNSISEHAQFAEALAGRSTLTRSPVTGSVMEDSTEEVEGLRLEELPLFAKTCSTSSTDEPDQT